MLTNVTKMFIFSCLIISAAALSCMDENNNTVDWFVVYKLPAKKHENKLITEGTAYTFITSENTTETLSTMSIKDTNSIIGRSLSKLYNETKNINYLVYNDQPPDSKESSFKGHAKGVVLFDKESGLWLVHSVPHFPNLTENKYTYPQSGAVYGQSFLCISLNLQNLNKVGLPLQINEVAFYEKKISIQLMKTLPILINATLKFRNQTVVSRVERIVSGNGMEFETFAKSRKYDKDLYEDLVAPYLKTDLFVETWSNVRGKLESNCKSKYKFAVYKIPRIKHHSNFISYGVAYTYMTSESDNKWKFSDMPINSSYSIIANTLKNLYKDNSNYMYVIYNDEPTNRRANSSKGHNKGVVMANSGGGFWLVHSVPEFPDIQRNYTYPRSGSIYGQSFLCISLDLSNLDKVGIQLQYNQPDIYYRNILSNLQNDVPELIKVAEGITAKGSPSYHISNIVSKKGVQFTSFAKSGHFHKDLYEDLVAPYLRTNLLVETWPNGPGRLDSNCSKPYKVNNIESIQINVANVSFTSSHDHSKWAVSTSSDENPWLCIGDINRAKHQKVRGGGTVCLNNKEVAQDYQNTIDVVESCRNKKIEATIPSLGTI